MPRRVAPRSLRATHGPGTPAIVSYLGASNTIDRALTSFAEACADQNALDYKALRAAVASGRIKAETGL